MSPVRSRSEQTSEAALLAAVGGFLDAYAFLAHGGVFANAQTGNVVLFGVELANHQPTAALRHLPPIVAFVIGMITVEVFSLDAVRRWLRRPTRVILAIECVVFLVVGLLRPGAPNLIVTAAIAWAATLQVATFTKVGKVTYTTTITTGNLRSLISSTFDWLVRGNRSSAAPSRALAIVVLAFAAGALVGGLLTRLWHTHAVLAVVPVLLLILASLVLGTRRAEAPSDPDHGEV